MITRCPSCQTAFKVVPDQLRIAAGWVRCGHCGELFDGRAHLIQPAPAIGEPAESHAPPAEQPGSAPSIAMPASRAGAADLAVDPGDADAEADLQPAPPMPPQDPLAAGPSETGPTAAPEETAQTQAEPTGGTPTEPRPGTPPPYPSIAEMEGPAPADSLAFPERLGELRFRALDAEARDPFESPVAPISLDPDPRPAPGGAALEPYPFAPTRAAPEHPVPRAPEVPSFVRRARPHPFWDSRMARAVLWLALVLLVVALAAQWLHQERDWLAARFPPLRNAIAALCEPLDCSVRPYRLLDAIAINGSDFKAIDAQTFRLDLSVRNNADLEVATPSFQLTLADLQGQVLVRRVVDPAELGAPITLKAHGQFDATRALRIASAAQPDSITSYRVVAFYP